MRYRWKKILFLFLAIFVLLGGSFFVLTLPSGSSIAPVAHAQTTIGDDFGTGYLSIDALPKEDLRIVVVRFIRIALGVIGIIFLLFVIYGGFLWMTAGGNPQQVDKGKRVLVNATIGLIIIFMAFAITTFIFNILQDTANSSNPPGGSCTDGQINGCSRCIGGGWFYDPLLCPISGSEFKISDIETAHAGVDDNDNVYVCSSIQAQFNRMIDQSTAVGNVKLAQGGTDVSGTLNTRSRSIEFDPSETLQENTPYTMRYHTNILDSTGVALEGCDETTCSFDPALSEYTWNFTTGNETDVNAPVVTATKPISNQTNPAYPDRNVNRDTVIQVTFSEAVRATTIDDGTGSPVAENIFVEQIDAQGGAVLEQLDSSRFDVVTRTNGFDLYLRAPELYESFSWYRVTVQNIEDLCSIPMETPLVWEFQTNDTVPGVGSVYPMGTNVCPNVGALIANFNTSMYFDTVTIAVSEDSAANPPVFSAGMRAADLDPGPYRVNVTGGTWSADPASDFRVFTFTPNQSLNNNTTYFINIGTSRIIDGNGNTLSYSWNFAVTDPSSCACQPYIASINPAQGVVGQCVTIAGRCFNGSVPTNPSDPRYAQPSAVTFDGISAPITGSSRTYITTTVPDSFIVGSRPVPQVSITYNDPQLGTLTTNNTNVDYYINAPGQSDGPCLQSLSPSNACFGQTVRLNGIRFGNDPGVGNRATAQHNVSYVDGIVVTPDANVTTWLDSQIATLVPTNAADGGVAVTANGLLSNTIPFDLACGVGSSCSTIPASCSPDDSICSEGLICNTSSCICEAEAPLGTPRVKRPFPTCSSSCVNVLVGAEFTLDMDPLTLSEATIDVLPCADLDTDPDCATLFNSEILYDSIDYDPNIRQVNIAPQGPDGLGADTTYRVLLSDQIKGINGVSLGGLNFDRDNDNTNESYSWTFSTRADTNQCELSGLRLEPVFATIDRLGPPGALRYNAYPQGKNNICGDQPLNRNGFNYQWASYNPVLGTFVNGRCNGDTDCTNGQCLPNNQVGSSCTEQGPVNTLTAHAESSSPLNLTVVIPDDPAGPQAGFADVLINVITCSEDTDCTENNTVCNGSICDDTTKTCTPVITDLAPASGPIGRWTTIKGCYFGAQQGNGKVFFDSTEAVYPACTGGIWSSSEIIVEVPSLAGGGGHSVVVETNRNLTSNSADFNVTNLCAPSAVVPPTGVPGICRLRPAVGPVNNPIDVEGTRFGDSVNDPLLDYVSFSEFDMSRISATDVLSWGSEKIRVTVPEEAATGDVYVAVNACTSNSVTFTVGIGVNTPCDGDTIAPACQVDDTKCGSNIGLYCDTNSCTCKQAPGPFATAYPQGNDICRNVAPYVVFNQPMDKRTITPDTIQLQQGLITAGQCTVAITVDDEYDLYFNGQLIGQGFYPDWSNAETYQINPQPGENVIAIAGENRGSFASAVLHSDQCGVDFSTNSTWKYLKNVPPQGWNDKGFDDSSWQQAVSQGPYRPTVPWCPNQTAACVSGFPEPTTAEWIWSDKYIPGDLLVNLRKSFILPDNSNAGQVAISLSVQTLAEGELGCGNTKGCTVVYVQPKQPLTANAPYTILVAQEVQSIYGKPFTADVVFENLFTTGNSICELDHIDVRVNPPGVVKQKDVFTCADRDDCSDDQDPVQPGNQHTWSAQVYDASQIPLSAAYQWSESDPESIFSISIQNQPTLAVTPQARDGKATFTVNASDPVAGSVSTIITAQTVVCENPWPPYASYPFYDSETDFELSYCRDKGAARVCFNGTTYGNTCTGSSSCSPGYQCIADPRDDLPSLQDPVEQPGPGGSGIVKEFLFLPSGLPNDVIALRVYDNADFLSPREWYRRNVPNPGSPQSTIIDGYSAVRDGRTVYVSAARNVSGNTYSAYMYLLSYNNNADAQTITIYNQLLNRWHFTTNLTDAHVCSGATTFCDEDSDCNPGVSCLINATKIRRDTQRVTDMGAIRSILKRYWGTCSTDDLQGCTRDSECSSGACVKKNGTYPPLNSGSFLIGRSTSRWPSWKDTLGVDLGVSLPTDPLNNFSSCPPSYDQASCWDEVNRVFECAVGSHIYLYDARPNGNRAILYAALEYPQASWTISGQNVNPGASGYACPNFGIIFPGT